jgi:hypothetical protein
VIDLSQAYQHLPSFNNVLVQNIASGNTMIFNQAARDLLVAQKNHRIPNVDSRWRPKTSHITKERIKF